ncbi:UMP-CMP kinase isoform X1 [Urocitellus parryii]
MLRRCCGRLLHVLGPSSPLLTRLPLLCLHSLMKPLVVFVLGGPGAGKGTQCARIVEKYGYTHLSAGELLRDERKNPDSQYGELIEKYIKDGKIVPVEITISLLKRISLTMNILNSFSDISMDSVMQEMDQTMAANAEKNKFLIDGFPRNQDNLQGWNKTMDGKADVSFVLFFDCDNEICIERCLERGKSSGRSDDNRESLEKRIQTYLQSTKPIIDLYEEMGKVKKIDASKSVDEVFDEVVKIFDKEG